MMADVVEPSSPRVRDRATIVTSGLLLVLAVAAWSVVLSMRDQDMGMDAMPMSVSRGLVFVSGWAVMMTAMMLPSALPMIALYGATQRGSAEPTRQGVPVAIFTLVYLIVWAVTGAPVYVAQEALAALPPTALSYAVAVILLTAGAFQLSPLKQACLRACRSPLGFLLGHWRAGYRGSLVLGWSHAAYCLGCCWALMLVLVAAGAMGLPWVLLIAALVAAEKLVPGGEWIARIVGGALVVLAVTVTLRPDLVATLRGGHTM
jgi:predicted metal-binding membrane protein